MRRSDLLAKAVYQSIFMVADTTPSRASPLPHGWCSNFAHSGQKTRLKELAAVGIKPILLMVGETVFLVVLVLLLLRWGF